MLLYKAPLKFQIILYCCVFMLQTPFSHITCEQNNPINQMVLALPGGNAYPPCAEKSLLPLYGTRHYKCTINLQNG